MPYDPRKELKRVRDYYNQDPLQKRFSAIISGDIGSGKTYLLSTARFPVHIDSFDPGGTKCLKPWIDKGDIVADTRWEDEDPFNPKAYTAWERDMEVRIKTGYFDMFGTYALDLSMFSDAVMNYQQNLAGRAGEVPMHRRDYNPQKTIVVNKIKRLMSLKCDFFLLAHLRELEDSSIDTKGNVIKNYRYRLNITGNAVLTIPLQFDELYVLLGTGSPIKREMLIESQGKYIARSRLKSLGKLSNKEEPDIKKLLKKIGLDWQDKPKLDFTDE
jgi:hypothetical protein